MSHWSLDDIPWHAFDASKLDPDLVSLAKAACMVEHNGGDYARYLCEVFHDDPALQQAARIWAQEEIQHGKVLRRWAELADPSFDFAKSFARFTAGYQLPFNVDASVRGSKSGELTARCVVEIGTSSYYSAIKDYTDEPVLKAICAKIAADEFRHYKLFYTYQQQYLEKEKLGSWGRLKVALGRIAESEDDELAYAFYAAHHPDGNAPYDRKLYVNQYWKCTRNLYRKNHVDKMVAMLLKAAGVKPYEWCNRLLGQLAWMVMQFRQWLIGFSRAPASL